MDEIDALFGSTNASAASLAQPKGAVQARQRASAAPWDDEVPMPPHPSDSGRPFDQRGQGQSQRMVSEAAQEGYARSAAPGSASGHRGQVVRPLSDARRDFTRAHEQTGSDEDGHRGWDGGEDDRAAPQQSGAGTREERDYYSVHIYGGKAALCFQADTTRYGREGETNTVRLEAAPSSGTRQYNWSDKIAVQFTVKELPFVLAVFMGWMPSVTFKAHGPQQDKGFSMEHQSGGKMFVKVWQAKRAMAVPLYAQDLYAVVALVLRQMAKNQAFLGVDGVMAVVRQLSSVYQDAGLGVQPTPARSAA